MNRAVMARMCARLGCTVTLLEDGDEVATALAAAGACAYNACALGP